MVEEKKSELKKCLIPENDSNLKKLGVKICYGVEDTDYIKGSNVSKLYPPFIELERGVGKERIYISQRSFPIRPKMDSEGWEVSKFEITEDEHFRTKDDIFKGLEVYTKILIENGISDTIISSFVKGSLEKKKPKMTFDADISFRDDMIRALSRLVPEEIKNISKKALEFIESASADQKSFSDLTSRFTRLICYGFDLEDFKKLGSIGGVNNIMIDDNWHTCKLFQGEKVPYSFIEKLQLESSELLKVGRSTRIPEDVLKSIFEGDILADEDYDMLRDLINLNYLSDDLVLSILKLDYPDLSMPLTRNYNIPRIAVNHIFDFFNYGDYKRQLDEMNESNLQVKFYKLIEVESLWHPLKNETYSLLYEDVDLIDKVLTDTAKELEKRKMIKVFGKKWAYTPKGYSIERHNKELLKEHIFAPPIDVNWNVIDQSKLKEIYGKSFYTQREVIPIYTTAWDSQMDEEYINEVITDLTNFIAKNKNPIIKQYCKKELSALYDMI